MDTVLLNIILVVTSTTNCVDVTPSNYSMSPPTVIRTRCVSALCGLIYTKMRPYVNVFSLGPVPLVMKKIVLLPFGMRLPTPWATMSRSLTNTMTHVFDSVPLRNCLYYCDIPVTGSITSLALKWLHASCNVRICVTKEYLEAVWPVLGFCRR